MTSETKDNAIPEDIFNAEREHIKGLDYQAVDFEDKTFYVQHPTPEFLRAACTAVCELEGRTGIQVLLAFHRQSIGYQDCSWRIHADTKIKDMWPHRAAVIYMSEPETELGETGTMFWDHEVHGQSAAGLEEAELERLLAQDSNDLSRWSPRALVQHIQNRLLTYPCDWFHSKYPKRFKKSREVFVMFYQLGEEHDRRGQAENENGGVGSEVRDADGRALRAA